jgi:2-dehydropantoate 2-reductase
MPLRDQPLPDKPVIAIIGTGAVGAYYGADLVRGGFGVHFLFRSDYQTVVEQGLRIESFEGNFDVPARELQAYDDVARMPRADIAIVALKATSNHLFPQLVAPLLQDHTAIVTMQNGLGNEEDLARLFGANRVLGGMAFICNNRLGPGHVRHISEGWVRLGEFSGAPGVRTEQIRQMFLDSGVECRLIPNLRQGRWEKILWNLPFNGLGALLNATTDRLLATPESEAMVLSLMHEAMNVAGSMNMNWPDDWIADKIAMTRRMGAYKTSMQIDREQHRPMEIEAIVGRPVKVARQQKVDAPRMEMLWRMLCTLEKQTDQPPSREDTKNTSSPGIAS